MSHVTKVRTTLTNKVILRETLSKLGLNWSEVENSRIYASDMNGNSNFGMISGKKTKIENERKKINLKKNPRIDFMVAQENGDSNIIFLWNGDAYEIGVDFNHWSQKSSATFFVQQIEQEYALNLLKATAENLGLETDIQIDDTISEKSYKLVCKGWQHD